MAKLKKYTVTGTHRVREVKPGESLELDPSEPQTVRLLARGQIVPASSRQQSADGASVVDAPSSEENEE